MVRWLCLNPYTTFKMLFFQMKKKIDDAGSRHKYGMKGMKIIGKRN